MKARSAKNKGARYENFLVDIIRQELDPSAHRTYGSGSGLDKNDIIIPKYGIEIEAKNHKKIALTDWWNQVERQRTPANIPILVARDPRRPEFERSFAVCDLNDFIVLLTRKDPSARMQINTPVDYKERAFQYQLEKTREEIRKLTKLLGD